jgi:hypothetical protein
MDNPVKRRMRDWDYYATVRYRTVALIVSLGLAAVVITLVILQPPWLVRAWSRLTGAGEAAAGEQAVAQARFINLDGSVKVKRRNSTQWEEADLRLPLEAGDAIQNVLYGMWVL